MACFRCCAGRLIISVKARPNSMRTAITAYDGEHLYVNINAVPDKDRANKELVGHLSQVFGVPKRSIGILRGRASHCKVVEIAAHLTEDEALRILNKTIGE